MIRSLALTGLMVAAVALGGCKKEADEPGEGTASSGREIGTFSESGTGTTRPAGTSTANPAQTMPNDAIHANLRPGIEMVPKFDPPDEWQPKPARSMTDEVYALPKAEGDPEDADLAVSHLTQHIPLQGNIARWCGFFGYQGQACEENAKKQELKGTKYPTVLVDISGTYTASSMMGPSGPPKENYRMLVAEIRTPQQPYYVRLTGPQQTVAKWEEAFMKFVREAK